MRLPRSVTGVLVFAGLLLAHPIGAEPQASDRFDPFGAAAPSFPFCFQFTNFCDGIEFLANQPGDTLVASWENYDCGGSNAPMLGSFDVNTVIRVYVDGSISASGNAYMFTFDHTAKQFFLRLHDTSFTTTEIRANEPYTISPGACPFEPQSGKPSSAAASSD